MENSLSSGVVDAVDTTSVPFVVVGCGTVKIVWLDNEKLLG